MTADDPRPAVVAHNHVSFDIKAVGECPACDQFGRVNWLYPSARPAASGGATDGEREDCYRKVGWLSEDVYCGRHGRAAGWPCSVASQADGELRDWRLEDGDSRCQRCGKPNPTWFAPSRLWNAVVGGDPDREAGGVLCPTCFCADAERLLADAVAVDVTVQRVRVLAEAWANLGPYAATAAGSWRRDGLRQAAADLRRALDGDQ